MATAQPQQHVTVAHTNGGEAQGPHPLEHVGSELIGTRIEVLWQGTAEGDKWYGGQVVSYADDEHTVVYDDGDSATYDLTTVTVRVNGVVYEPDESSSDSESEGGSVAGDDVAAPGAAQPADAVASTSVADPMNKPPLLKSGTDSRLPIFGAAGSGSRRGITTVPPLQRGATTRARSTFSPSGGATPLSRNPLQPLSQPPVEAGDGSMNGAAQIAHPSPPPSTQPDAQSHGVADNAGTAASAHIDGDLSADAALAAIGVHDGDGAAVEALRPDTAVPQPPGQHEHSAAIDQIRLELHQVAIPAYEEQLESVAAQEEVVVASVPVEEAEAAEREMEEARLRAAQVEAEEFHSRQRLIAVRETAARRRVAQEETAAADRLRRREAQAMERASVREQSIRRVWLKAEAQLRDSIQAQQGVVEARYGKLVTEDEAARASKKRQGAGSGAGALTTRAGARRLRAKWRLLPQPMELEVLRVTALKDKAPPGRYVALVTLYDRLGGQPLQWSKQPVSRGIGSNQASATQPVHHRGRFYDTDLEFDEAIYCLGPPEPQVNPAMVYIIELFLLGSRRRPVDQVVGWAALPYCDARFRPSSGKFKLPLLRGEVDLDIDKFADIEARMANDLDSWLANVYVSVNRLPRERLVGARGGKKKGAKTAVKGGGDEWVLEREFDVELSYTSELLRLPNRKGRLASSDSKQHDLMSSMMSVDGGATGGIDGGGDGEGGWGSDYDDHVTGDGRKRGTGQYGAGAGAGAGAVGGALALRRGKIGMGATARVAGPTGEVGAGNGAGGGRGGRSGLGAVIPKPSFSFITDAASGASPSLRSSMKGSRALHARQSSAYTAARPGVAWLGGGDGSQGRQDSARKLRVRLANSGDPSNRRTKGAGLSRAALVGTASTSRRSGHSSGGGGGVLRRRGRASSRRRRRGSDGDGTSGTAAGSAGHHASTTNDDTLARDAMERRFQYAITRPDAPVGHGGATVSETKRKMRHLASSVISDLTSASALSFEFWIQIVLLFVALWIRVYIHYIGQWLFLKGQGVPIFSFDATPYSVMLKYVPALVPMEVELGVIIMGPLFCCTVFAVFMGLAVLFNVTLGHFPEITSRFIAMFGFATFLDPLLILIVDLAAGNYNCTSIPACAVDITSDACGCVEGDAFKLYQRFQIEEGSGVVGIFLAVFVYVVVLLVAVTLLYLYLLHVHLSGRMLDVYRRLHATEDSFFLPADLEVSASDLAWIVMKARKWRGPKGTQRKIAVCDYVLTDPLDVQFRETTTHLLLYHAGVNGERELYRHFLRLPDGTAIELFGDLSSHFGGNFGALGDLLTGKRGDDAGGGGGERMFNSLVTEQRALI